LEWYGIKGALVPFGIASKFKIMAFWKSYHYLMRLYFT